MKRSTEAVRVDKWLWAVRAFRTRTAASEACAAGRVTVNDEPAKPATRVRAGDVVSARRRDRTIVYQVEAPLTKRVSATLAAEAVTDLSPPVPPSAASGEHRSAGARERGEGRPTKRDRRRIDQLRGRT